MRDERYCRNPCVMRVLKTMGLIEEYGEGINRLCWEVESRLLVPPATFWPMHRVGLASGGSGQHKVRN